MSSHDRNQEFSYDAEDLIKASKYERNFGTGWNHSNIMQDPQHVLLKLHKQNLQDEHKRKLLELEVGFVEDPKKTYC